MMCFLLMCVVIVVGAALTGMLPWWWATQAASGAFFLLPLLVLAVMAWRSHRTRSLAVASVFLSLCLAVVVGRVITLRSVLNTVDVVSSTEGVEHQLREHEPFKDIISIELLPGALIERLHFEQSVLRIAGGNLSREELISQPGSVLLASTGHREFLVEPVSGWKVAASTLGEGSIPSAVLERKGNNPLMLAFVSSLGAASGDGAKSAKITARRIFSLMRHSQTPAIAIVDIDVPLLHPWLYDVAYSGNTNLYVPENSYFGIFKATLSPSGTYFFLNAAAQRQYLLARDGDLVRVIGKKADA